VVLGGGKAGVKVTGNKGLRQKVIENKKLAISDWNKKPVTSNQMPIGWQKLSDSFWLLVSGYSRWLVLGRDYSRIS
jgi:hypothetical protein